MTGNIDVQSLSLKSTAVVHGDIKCRYIDVQPRASVFGNMTVNPLAEVPPAVVEEAEVPEVSDARTSLCNSAMQWRMTCHCACATIMISCSCVGAAGGAKGDHAVHRGPSGGQAGQWSHAGSRSRCRQQAPGRPHHQEHEQDRRHRNHHGVATRKSSVACFVTLYYACRSMGV